MNVLLDSCPALRGLLVSMSLCCLADARVARADPLDSYLFANNEALRDELQTRLPPAPAQPWLEDPEVRVAPEVDANDSWTQTYSLRLRPRSRRERDTSRELFDIENELATVEWDQTLSGGLSNRYHRVADLAALEVELGLARARLTLARSVLDSEMALAATPNFSPARLRNTVLRLELGELEAQRIATRTAQLRSNTIADYLIVAEGATPAVSGRLVGPDTIDEMLDSVTAGADSTSHYSSLARLELERARQQMILEKSRSGFGLNLLELTYENKGVDSYNFMVGIRLPFAQRIGEHQRRKRAFVAAAQYSSYVERSLADSVRQAVYEIRLQIDAFTAEEAVLQTLGSRLPPSAADPAALTALRRHQLQLLESAAKKHVDVLHGFIDLLHLAGWLQRQPLTNWIRSDQS